MLYSGSRCCLIGELVGSPCGDTERSLVQTEGLWAGFCSCTLSCAAGKGSDRGTWRFRSGLPNNHSSLRWNVRSFVFFKLTSVPCFGPAWCFSYLPLFLKNYAKANFNLRYSSCVDQSPSVPVPAGLGSSWILGLFPSLWLPPLLSAKCFVIQLFPFCSPYVVLEMSTEALRKSFQPGCEVS